MHDGSRTNKQPDRRHFTSYPIKSYTTWASSIQDHRRYCISFDHIRDNQLRENRYIVFVVEQIELRKPDKDIRLCCKGLVSVMGDTAWVTAVGTVRKRFGHLEGSATALEALDGSFNKSDEVRAMMEVKIEAAIANVTSRTWRRGLVKTNVRVIGKERKSRFSAWTKMTQQWKNEHNSTYSLRLKKQQQSVEYNRGVMKADSRHGAKTTSCSPQKHRNDFVFCKKNHKKNHKNMEESVHAPETWLWGMCVLHTREGMNMTQNTRQYSVRTRPKLCQLFIFNFRMCTTKNFTTAALCWKYTCGPRKFVELQFLKPSLRVDNL